jgi:hypothetical protein
MKEKSITIEWRKVRRRAAVSTALLLGVQLLLNLLVCFGAQIDCFVVVTAGEFEGWRHALQVKDCEVVVRLS